MKKLFESEIDKGIKDTKHIADKWTTYMFLWYALLYSVLETFEKYGVSFPEVQNDIDDVLAPLRRLRNAVFHPQSKYWSPKLFEFIGMNESVRKIHSIHSHLGRYFLSEFKKNE
ncbi:MAG: hypothetical protein ABIK83_15590 [Candidatus Zixiibacteriota bacterium]